jgi:glutaredoxin 3
MDQMGDDGPALQMALLGMSGQKSVPNVFVKGQHIGGNEETQNAAKDGKLKELLGL